MTVRPGEGVADEVREAAAELAGLTSSQASLRTAAGFSAHKGLNMPK